MSPRAHFACGVPIVLAGMTGSLFVLAVNAWMNDPGGFTLRPTGPSPTSSPVKALFGNGHVGYELVHMYLAGFIVARLPRRGRLRGRAPARALGALRADRADDPADGRGARGARAGRSSATGSRARSPRRSRSKLAALEGLGHTRARRGAAPRRLVRRRRGQGRDRAAEGPLAAGLPRPERDGDQGLDSVPEADRPPVNVVRISFQLMVVDRDVPRGAERVVPLHARAAQARRRSRLVLPRCSSSRGRCRSSR